MTAAAWTAGLLVVAASLAVGAWWIGHHRWPRRDRPRIVLAGPPTPHGTVHLRADVVVRAVSSGAGTPVPQGDVAEMDVPTAAVDRILGAMRKAGFSVADTGLTVDTDEGEETLTTIRMDLSSAAPMESAGSLHIHGDLVLEAGARLHCPAHVDGDTTLADRAAATADLHVGGNLRTGRTCHLGSTTVRGEAHVGPGTRATSLRVGGDAFFDALDPEAIGVLSARRVHVGRP